MECYNPKVLTNNKEKQKTKKKKHHLPPQKKHESKGFSCWIHGVLLSSQQPAAAAAAAAAAELQDLTIEVIERGSAVNCVSAYEGDIVIMGNLAFRGVFVGFLGVFFVKFEQKQEAWAFWCFFFLFSGPLLHFLFYNKNKKPGMTVWWFWCLIFSFYAQRTTTSAFFKGLQIFFPGIWSGDVFWFDVPHFLLHRIWWALIRNNGLTFFKEGRVLPCDSHSDVALTHKPSWGLCLF